MSWITYDHLCVLLIINSSIVSLLLGKYRQANWQAYAQDAFQRISKTNFFENLFKEFISLNSHAFTPVNALSVAFTTKIFREIYKNVRAAISQDRSERLFLQKVSLH